MCVMCCSLGEQQAAVARAVPAGENAQKKETVTRVKRDAAS